jgi:electron transfer flavoprotein alpha subunit
VDCIVLVKQVPDVSNIPEDAWDTEKGTLRRAMLESILNPLDLHAVTFGRLVTAGAPGSRTAYLTMGPPQARDALVDCMSRAPGEAILLTDRGFAGADTVATAYSLACAIRRIERELFGGGRDYVIVAGMQSVDGDTAQVPPQIAEELGIPHIAYVRRASLGPALEVERIGPEGTETVRPRRLPVLLTVTGCTEPLYRSFALAREARQAPIREWSAASVDARPERIGLRGSRTQVYRLFSPTAERSRSCRFVHAPAELVRLLADSYREGPHAVATPGHDAPTRDAYALAGRTPSYRGEFWVFAEHGGAGIRDVSLALVGRARALADSVGSQVGAVLPCGSAGDMPDALIASGADRVYVVEHPLLRHFVPTAYCRAIAPLIRERRPQVMLFGATPLGRELAPRVAYACDCGLTADCTKLEIGDYEKGDTSLVAILRQTRPALGGNVMATIMTRQSATQMATVRPGVFRVPVPDATRAGEVERVPADISEDDVGVDIVAAEAAAGERPVRDAAIVVSGGRGFRSRAEFEACLGPLADGLGTLLGGTSEVGASRMAVEDGYAARDCQVGQTGRTVQPRLYVAVGISGAVQHVSGMQNSGIVVAINRDPRARIFDYADFGLVGEIDDVVPALVDAVREAAHATH